MDVVAVLTIMIVTGMLGGVIGVVLRNEPTQTSDWWTGILAGIGAALLIPLFLRTVSSTLVDDVLKENTGLGNVLVFAGFCLLAAITARVFIQNLSVAVLQRKLEETQQAAHAAANDAREAVEKQRETRNDLSVAFDVARDEARYLANPNRQAPTDENLQLAPVELDLNRDDPPAGAFGGQFERDGWRLSARLLPDPTRPNWKAVRLRVVAPIGATASRSVRFYLHPTLSRSPVEVPILDGEARLAFSCWGAFTVGVQTDTGILLELDLSRLPEADEPWRSR